MIELCRKALEACSFGDEERLGRIEDEMRLLLEKAEFMRVFAESSFGERVKRYQEIMDGARWLQSLFDEVLVELKSDSL
jgi:hypothetical protein